LILEGQGQARLHLKSNDPWSYEWGPVQVAFDPGGMHIMLVGLKQPLKEGQTFPLTLTFRKAGKVDVM